MRKTLLLLATLALLSFELAEAEVLIVVNKKNSVEEMSLKELQNIYLMKKRTWADGTQILPLDLFKKTALRKSFSNGMLKKTPSKMARFYFKRAVSGGGQPPRTYSTEEEIVDFIVRNPGAIGYISKENPRVKVIRIIKDK
ncbi:MAG: hypothetical protein ACE5FU_03575 [Nitrospinota bacterium]